MEMESTVSSGRSTPAMMNGQSSSASSGAKTVAYPCCWDLCLQYFGCSPDLAEHIRSVHVDGQRGGVSARDAEKNVGKVDGGFTALLRFDGVSDIVVSLNDLRCGE